MYNGIGLGTARGSGTNGYVTKNLSYVRPRKENVEYKQDDEMKKLEQYISRKGNSELLEHERKRKIELKCAEMEDLMEEQGFKQDEIDKKVKSFRKQLQEKSEREREKPVELEFDENGKPIGDSHKQAEANDFKNKKLREAFGLGEYDPILKAKQMEEERLTRIEKAREMSRKNYQWVKDEDDKYKEESSNKRKHKKSSKKSKKHRRHSSTTTTSSSSSSEDDKKSKKNDEFKNDNEKNQYLDRFEGRTYQDLDDIDHNETIQNDTTRRHRHADDRRRRDYRDRHDDTDKRRQERNKIDEIEMRKQLEERMKNRDNNNKPKDDNKNSSRSESSDSDSDNNSKKKKKKLASVIVVKAKSRSSSSSSSSSSRSSRSSSSAESSN